MDREGKIKYFLNYSVRRGKKEPVDSKHDTKHNHNKVGIRNTNQK